MQRFIANLEATNLIDKLLESLSKAVSTATDTLKTNAKVHLSVNVCGPIVLFPQKSSSPNVMIIDTGELKIENFYKESNNDAIENILIKWTQITATRGVMTLTPSLEMQVRTNSSYYIPTS